MTRREALQRILAQIGEDDLALFTTGMISREAFDLRDRPANFYMLGSMGLLSSLGLGLALQWPARTIWVIEGDGSALMSLGTLPLIASCRPPNLVHIVLDNEVYESTGGQPTITSTIDLTTLAQAAGYPFARHIADAAALDAALADALAVTALRFMLVKVTGRAPEGIGRVTLTPEELKDRFARALMGAPAATHSSKVTPAGRR